MGSEPPLGWVTMTILPLSLPRQRAKSPALDIGATMTSPLITPLVPGVQATGMTRRSSGRGSVMRALARTIDQPRPNSNGSARTLDRPQSRKRWAVQVSASRICGELVMRPPMRSVR